MGYYVQMTDADFTIPERADVLAAIHDMDTRLHAIKRGGSSNGDKWFSWMPQDLTQFESVRAVFEDLGFECSAVGEEAFRLDAYDNKTGQEDLFLAVVAPFVADDSYTEWQGEDGVCFRYEVRQGRLMQMSEVREWTAPEPYTYAHFDSVGSMQDDTWRMFSVSVDPYADAETIRIWIEQASAGPVEATA